MVYFLKNGGDFNMEDYGIEFYTQTEKIYLGVFEGGFGQAHTHNFLELVYVLSGSAVHVMNGEETKISKGNYYIIDYDTKHDYRKINNEPFVIVNCLFLPEFIDKTLVKCRRFYDVMNNYLIHHSYKSINLNPVNQIFFDNDNTIGNIIDLMQNEYAQKRTGYEELLRCKLIEIIIFTMRQIQSNDRIAYNSVGRYITEYINDNYMKKITLKDISEKLSYSVPYLSKVFKEECGITFEQFLQKTRIDQSCRLLANTDKKIGDVAECVGYSDIKFFTAVFKRFMKLSPREYRKLHR